MSKKILLRATALLLLLLLTFSLVSCSASRAARASTRAGRVVATAGESDILYENLYYLAMTRIAEMKRVYGDTVFENPEERAALEQFVKENLVTKNDAMLSIGADFGLAYNKGEIGDDVQERMDGIIENYFKGDRDAYIESLNAEYLTDRYVRRYLAATEFMPAAIIEAMLIEGRLNDSDDAARATINGENFIRVSEILIESRNYKDDAAAKARAQGLRDRVAAKGSVEDRLDEWGEIWVYGTQAEATGDGIYFARGEMEKSFEEAAFSLEDYGVSEVLKVDGGYCILMRMPKDAAYIDEHFEELKQKTYYVTLNAMVEERLAAMPLVMTDFGSSLDLFELSVVDADGGDTLMAWLLVIGAVLLAAGVAVLVLVVGRKKGFLLHGYQKVKRRKK